MESVKEWQAHTFEQELELEAFHLNTFMFSFFFWKSFYI